MKMEKHFIDFLLSNMPLWYVIKQYELFNKIQGKHPLAGTKIETKEITDFYEYLQNSNFTDMLDELE